MAKQKSVLALVGGIIVLVAVLLSLIFEQAGWWVYGTYSGDEREIEFFVNAFGGGGFLSHDDNPLFSQEINYLLPGLLALVGAGLIMTQNKALSFIGGVIALASLVVFILVFGDNLPGTLEWIIDATDGNAFWDEQHIIFDNGIYWRFGYGYLGTAVGAIIGIVGSFTAHESR